MILLYFTRQKPHNVRIADAGIITNYIVYSKFGTMEWSAAKNSCASGVHSCAESYKCLLCVKVSEKTLKSARVRVGLAKSIRTITDRLYSAFRECLDWCTP